MTGIRLASLADLDALLRLMEAYYAEEGYAFGSALARRALGALLEDPALGRVWLMADAGAAVGYVAVTLGYSLERHGRNAFIDELYVEPAHRGQGIGAAALETAERACREMGVQALHLEVERDKPVAQGLYRSRGFAAIPRDLMTKRLAP